MSALLEINKKDIQGLTSLEAEELVLLLCEETLEKAGLSTKRLSGGGDFNAGDGGLDAYISPGYIPESCSMYFGAGGTGFQVKHSENFKVSKTTVERELLDKKEEPKCGIRMLNDENESKYILVCSKQDWPAYQKEQHFQTIKDVLRNLDLESIYPFILDSYDLAKWVNAHFRGVKWVRKKIGKPISGWKAYGNWSNPNGDKDEEYILCDKQRIYPVSGNYALDNPDNWLSAKEGILAIREKLSDRGYKAPLRLVGISGSGKTRLVEALFDERIESETLSEPLRKERVYYTDTQWTQVPPIEGMIEWIKEQDSGAILIIDNCSPKLHGSVVDISGPASGEHVKLLTIEYDIREDDQPEKTKVFRLEISDTPFIEELIKKRCPQISQLNRKMIAKISEGNARVALLVAENLNLNPNASLDIAESKKLFGRLFWQTEESNDDESLLLSAKALALVYSFDFSEGSQELEILASLTEHGDIKKLYRHVEELRKRKIIQARGDWRAILPPVIANWLAKKALDVIEPKRVVEGLWKCNRLRKSFAKRIGYLHNSQKAKAIVEDLLDLDHGKIGKQFPSLNREEMEIFEKIAPNSPEKVLDVLEKKSGCIQNANNKYFILLNQLCYERENFSKSVNIMIALVLSSTFAQAKKRKIVENYLTPLFYVRYSGTHASLDDRVKVIEDLAQQPDEESQELSMTFLEATLKTQNFRIHNLHKPFGLHSRDFGDPHLKTLELEDWFTTVIDMVVKFSCGKNEFLAEQARKILACGFRCLWSNFEESEKILASLEAAAEKLHKHKLWNEGWRAVRETIYFHSKKFENSSLDRLEKLEKYLYPSNLKEEIRLFVGSNKTYLLLPGTKHRNDNDHGKNARKISSHVESLGHKLTQDSELLKELLPELTIAQFSENRRHKEFLGRGIAKNNANRERISKILLGELKQPTSANSRKYPSVLFGFLTGCSQTDQNLCNEILDTIASDAELMVLLPELQSAKIYSDQRDIDRLLEHLDSNLDESTLHKYIYLHGAVLQNPNIFLVVDKILEKYPNGSQIVEEVVASTLNFLENKPSNFHLASCIKILSKSFSPEHESSRGNDGGHRGYNLSVIFETVLDFADEKETKQVCQKLCEDILKKIKENHYINGDDYRSILKRISKDYPYMFLNIFLLQDDDIDQIENSMSLGDVSYSGVPREDFIDWCREDPETRCKLMASVADLFRESDDHYELDNFFFDVLNEFRDQELILIQKSLSRIGRRSFWGPISNEYQKRQALIVNFLNMDVIQNLEAREWAEEQCAFLGKKISEMKEMEKRRNDRQIGFE